MIFAWIHSNRQNWLEFKFINPISLASIDPDELTDAEPFICLGRQNKGLLDKSECKKEQTFIWANIQSKQKAQRG